MKLLKSFEFETDAEILCERLRRKGIATYISGKFSSHYHTITGTFEYSVWVIADEQHPDAVRLLRYRRHAVEVPFTPDQIAEIEAAVNTPIPWQPIAALLLVLTIIAGLVLIFLQHNL